MHFAVVPALHSVLFCFVVFFSLFPLSTARLLLFYIATVFFIIIEKPAGASGEVRTGYYKETLGSSKKLSGYIYRKRQWSAKINRQFNLRSKRIKCSNQIGPLYP